jgi:23S rRNA (guanosine2251-2'-O)-methyltransferase
MKQTNILLLHNIRSVENVGAMFRTADAAGISKIYLSGYTPTPLDRFGRKRGDMAKSALGAEEFVPWEYKKSILPLIQKLKHDGFQIIGIEQSKEAADYRSIRTKHKNAFIMGTETTGIPEKILKQCDKIAEIPMQGKKESLNVSVALGIVLFRIL